MGLGKTVQTIALMAKSPPPENEEARSTLIVVPSALLQQVSCLDYMDRETLTYQSVEGRI